MADLVNLEAKIFQLGCWEKLLYKNLILSARVLLIILGFSLIFINIPILRLTGFWLIVIWLFHFIQANHLTKKDLRFKQDADFLEFAEEKTIFLILDSLKEAELLKIQNIQIVLLAKLLNQKDVIKILARLSLEPKPIQIETETYFKEIGKGPALDLKLQLKKFLLKNIEPILIWSIKIARDLNYPSISPAILFVALREKGDLSINEIFEKFNIDQDFLKSALALNIFKEKIGGQRRQSLAKFHLGGARQRWHNRSWTSRPTPILDQFGTDLTNLARANQVGFIIGHGKELNEIMVNLNQFDKFNLLLIGRAGSGRTSLVWRLAWLISRDLVPEKYFDFRVIELNLNEIFAADPRNFHHLLISILNETAASQNTILFLPEIDQILLANISPSPLSLLQPFLESNSNVSFIATTTIEAAIRLKHLYQIENYFNLIEIDELQPNEAINLLSLESLLLEKKEGILITPQAIARSVSLAERFISTKPLPASARSVINEAFSLAKAHRLKIITEEIIGDIISQSTKIPITDPGQAEKHLLENLEAVIHQRLIDQDFAVKEVSRVLKTYRSGLIKSKGPIGSFLFVGPTGVGKTELAKILARTYFGGETEMIRIDMVQFQNSTDIENLIGSADGQTLGRLTETVRAKPYSLILLDEFEKAGLEIINLFLPIFDDGLIKDGLGREIKFDNTIIIATSNAHSNLIKTEFENGKTIEAIADEVKTKLNDYFPIELLNRFDGVIFFKPLGPNELRQIAELLIGDLSRDLLFKFGANLKLTEPALAKIVELGYNPTYGARPLARVIEKEIKSLIAETILKTSLNRGSQINIDYNDQDNKFVFKTTPPL